MSSWLLRKSCIGAVQLKATQIQVRLLTIGMHIVAIDHFQDRALCCLYSILFRCYKQRQSYLGVTQLMA